MLRRKLKEDISRRVFGRMCSEAVLQEDMFLAGIKGGRVLRRYYGTMYFEKVLWINVRGASVAGYGRISV